MQRREFKAESKRLLDLMINSIYTHKEIFLRELISNSSDAIDKIYYRALTDDDLEFNKNDYYIKIKIDRENRKLIISDTGIGMSKEELDENLGVIAKSGSFDFKSTNEIKDGHDIIGQFGVGFYSAFMVADRIEVISRTLDGEKAYRWESSGEDGYMIEEADRDKLGTDIILKIKESTEDEDYDQYLEEYRIIEIIKKYSDYIRYPIKMDVTNTRLKEGKEDEYEEYVEEEVINSMVPIWRRNRNDLDDEDYENFYREKRFGFDKPARSIHMTVDGLLRFNSILFIPSETPYDFYTNEYEKGLELYSSGVMIMEKCSDLLPDYFSFVKGVVDSEDLSLNISREMLQQDRQLSLIARNIENRIKSELETMLKEDREDYEAIFKNFGMQLKYGIYDNFGRDKEKLQDLVLFYSSKDKEYITLKEYLERMKEDQDYIYYATGESIDRVDSMPQTELLKDKGYEILYLVDHIDEFVIKMMNSYDEKEFKSVTADDLGIESDEDREEIEEKIEENKDLFSDMIELLDGKVVDVRPSNKLKNHPVCFSTEGDISLEMEKVLRAMPEGDRVRAEKILEINVGHEIFERLKKAHQSDEEKFGLYVDVLYDQALLIEGLKIEDPVEFTNNICKLM